MKGPGLTRLIALLGLLAGVMALALAPQAQAKFIRKPLGPFGSAAQPSFVRPAGLALDQGTGELYVLSGGDEDQAVKVSATAGEFRLKFEGETTADIAFNAPAFENPASVQAALEALPSIGAGNVGVREGPGDAAGSHSYIVQFEAALKNTDLEQLSCENGTTPLSGGSGCSVSTEQDGEPVQVTRWNADGTPSSFSALLGSNSIDGRGSGEDQTPDNSLESASAVAIDNSGGATDGDIYVTRERKHAVDIFAPSGKYLGQLSEYKEGPTASGPLKALNNPCGVTVDPAGNAYVGDATLGTHSDALIAIHKYHPAANPAVNADNNANFDAGSINTFSCHLAAGAGPTAGYVFSSGSEAGHFGGSPQVIKLDSSTGERKLNLGGGRAIAVDPASGYVFIGGGNQVFEYDASGSEPPLPRQAFAVTDFPHGPIALAADATSEDVYVARENSSQLDAYGPVLIIPDVVTEVASEVTGTSATLNGTISAASGPGASCHFQYTTEAAYLADKAIEGHDGFSGAQSAPCQPAGPFSGAATNAVSAEVTGLGAETRYEFRVVGENVNGENQGAAQGFETLGKPAIEGGLASEITTTTAKISGEINPRGLPSTFAVQYLTQAQFEAGGYSEASTTPAKEAGSGSGFVEVSQQLTGLEPGVAYHFRLVAENEAGAAEPGKDRTFTTFLVPSGLPEGRAYEQVSPAVKLGEVFPPLSQGGGGGLGGACRGCVPGWQKGRMPMRSSPDGEAVAYEGNPFSAGLASGPNEYVANRGAGGWATTPLSGPAIRRQLQRSRLLGLLGRPLPRCAQTGRTRAVARCAPQLCKPLPLADGRRAHAACHYRTSQPLAGHRRRKLLPRHIRRRQLGHGLGAGLQPPDLPGQRRAERRSAGDRPQSAAGRGRKKPTSMSGQKASFAWSTCCPATTPPRPTRGSARGASLTKEGTGPMTSTTRSPPTAVASSGRNCPAVRSTCAKAAPARPKSPIRASSSPLPPTAPRSCSQTDMSSISKTKAPPT